MIQAIEHRVRGILILPVIAGDSRTRDMLNEAESRGIPVVLMDREIPSASFDSVSIDNRKVVYQGIRLLIEGRSSGNRNYYLPRSASEKAEVRQDGYIKCMKDYGLPIIDEYIYPGDFDEKSGYEACSRFFSLIQPPTAVLATLQFRYAWLYPLYDGTWTEAGAGSGFGGV